MRQRSSRASHPVSAGTRCSRRVPGPPNSDRPASSHGQPPLNATGSRSGPSLAMCVPFGRCGRPSRRGFSSVDRRSECTHREGCKFRREAQGEQLGRKSEDASEPTATVLDIDGVLVGYVGRAHVVGEAIDAWLRGFFDRHAGSPLRELGPALGEELEAAWSGRPEAERGTIIHLGGFEEGSDGSPLPVVWYVRDFEIQDDGRYAFIGGFEARDELKQEGRS